MDGASKGQALVCVENRDLHQKTIKALEALGYQTPAPKTLEQIKNTPYKVIVLEEGFQGMTIGENPIYQAVIQMSMVLRRNTFLILLGMGGPDTEGLDTAEALCAKAFSMSADLLLDKEKVRKEEELAPLLQREIAQHEKFYQVYWRVKEQISQGK